LRKIATLTAAIGRGAQQYLWLHLRSSTHSPFQLRNVFVMRAIWKGSISFGLVNIPIALYPATRREELKFRLLRAKDLSPVNYKRMAEKDGKEVPWDDLVKGIATPFTTDDQGYFRLPLEPDHYIVSLKDKKGGIGHDGPFEVDLVADRMTKVAWRCDTGIR
jgi:hypothetical protein